MSTTPQTDAAVQRWKDGEVGDGTHESGFRHMVEVAQGLECALRDSINEASVRTDEANGLADRPDGSWIDKWGVCRVCGGEIPYGHTDKCDIYRYERIEQAAEKMEKALSQYRDTYARASDLERVEMWTIAGEVLTAYRIAKKESVS